MITRVLSQKLVLLVIGLAAGSGILVPAGYASFHPVTSSEIADGTIQSIDIGDGQVKTVDIGGGAVNSAKIADNSIIGSDLAANSVGASELQGVSKLLFSSCTKTDNTSKSPGSIRTFTCVVPGTDFDDYAVAQINSGTDCFAITFVGTLNDNLLISVRNVCSSAVALHTVTFAIIVYHTEFIRG